MRVILILSAAGLLAGCATPVIENPSWASIPDGRDMSDAYPAFAEMMGFHGAARLNCIALEDGSLSDCRATEASPSGMGFDRAALGLVPRFVINPRQVDGHSGKARVSFAVRFRLPPPDEPPAPWTGPEPDPLLVQSLKPIVTAMIDAALRETASTDLDLDEDRTGFVRDLMAVTAADLRDQSINAMALTMARVVSPEQAAAIAAGRVPPGRPPSEEAMIAAGDRMEEVGAEYDRRVQAGYCARYECVDKIPQRAPSVNANGPVGGPE